MGATKQFGALLAGNVRLIRRVRSWVLDKCPRLFRKHVEATELDIVLSDRVTVLYSAEYTGLPSGSSAYSLFCHQ